jgi:hypothetical protein
MLRRIVCARVFSFLGLAICLSLAAGCSQNYSDKRAHEALAEHGLKAVGAKPLEEIGSIAAAPGRIDVGGLTAMPPVGWEQLTPSSSMRLAEFRLPGQPMGSGDATLAIFYFGRGQGGSLENNIDRWYGQFDQPDGGSTKESSRRWQDTVYGMPVTMVDIAGTFTAGMGSGARADEPAAGYRMLGAIVESGKGPFFFKLIGPKATVSHWNPSFTAFISSIQ